MTSRRRHVVGSLTLVALLATAAADAQVRLVSDTFTRADSASLGVTETGGIAWGALGRTHGASAFAAPKIRNNALAFVSSTSGTSAIDMSDVGIGVMQAYLNGYTVRDMTLTVDVTVTSFVADEDEWMGVVWRKSAANGSQSDGYLFLIRPTGGWQFLADGANRQFGSVAPLGSGSHRLAIVASGTQHTVSVDGVQLVNMVDATNPDAGYVSLATFHNDLMASTMSGTFDRTFDNFSVRDDTLFSPEDYGATPNNPNDDDRPGIQAAVDAAVARGPGSTVVLAAGQYRITSSSGSPFRKAVRIPSNGATISGITFQGQGAATEIVIADPTVGGFEVTNCTGCVLRRFTLDYEPPPFTQGTIVAINPGSPGSFDLQIGTGVATLDHPMFCTQRAPNGVDCLQDKATDWGMVFHPSERHLKANIGDAFYIASWTKVGTGLYRLVPTTSSQIMLSQAAVNDRFVYMNRTNSEHAIILTWSQNTVTEDITIRSSIGAVVVGLGTTAHRMTRVSVRYAPGTSRLLTTNADGAHFQLNPVGPTVEDCFFEGLADDAVAVYTPENIVCEFVPPATVVLASGLDGRLNDGRQHQLQVFDPVHGVVRGEAAATAVTKLTQATKPASCPGSTQGFFAFYRVTLSPAVAGITAGSDARTADHMYDLSASGDGYVARRNTMQSHRRHGVLAMASNGLIEDNVMTDLTGQGIVIENQHLPPLGPIPRNLTIRRNKITNVGSSLWYKKGGIEILTQAIDNRLAPGYGQRNIVIEDNELTGWDGRGIYVGSAEDVQIRNNRVVLNATGPNYVLQNHRAVTMTFTAAQQFSGVQGQDQWGYLSWDGTTYSTLLYQPVDATHPVAYWYRPTGYHRVFAGYMHPDAGADAVRSWVAPFPGTVMITGQVAKADVGGGDGVNAKIVHDAAGGPTTIYNQDIAFDDRTGYAVNVTRTVAAGDTLYFRVNARGTTNYDATAWNPTVTLAVAPGTTYSASAGFSGTQGQDQWYYKYWNGTSYAGMAYQPVDASHPTAYWYAPPAPSSIINITSQHPAANADSVRTWIAPSAGTVTITGSIRLYSAGGDGVLARIFHNGTQIFSRDIAGSDTSTYPTNVVTPRAVAAGDAIYFSINQKATLNYDGTYWDPAISFYQ